MAKQKTHIFIALVLVLLIIAAVVAWVTHDDSDKPDTDSTPQPITSSEVIVTTPEPANTPSPMDSPSPVVTFNPVETPRPTEAPKPVDPQGDGRINESGRFSSDTGTSLNLIVDWNVISKDSHTLSVKVNVYVQSYSLDIGKRSGNTIYVNGNGYNFVSSPISHTDNNSLQKTLITTVTVDVPAEAGTTVNIPISVDWHYRGAYNGQEIEHIHTESVLKID